MSETPEHFRGRSVEFPVIQNREFTPTNREVVGIRSDLGNEGLAPIHPLSRMDKRDKSTDLWHTAGGTNGRFCFGFRSAEFWHHTAVIPTSISDLLLT